MYSVPGFVITMIIFNADGTASRAYLKHDGDWSTDIEKHCPFFSEKDVQKMIKKLGGYPAVAMPVTITTCIEPRAVAGDYA